MPVAQSARLRGVTRVYRCLALSGMGDALTVKPHPRGVAIKLETSCVHVLLIIESERHLTELTHIAGWSIIRCPAQTADERAQDVCEWVHEEAMRQAERWMRDEQPEHWG